MRRTTWERKLCDVQKFREAHSSVIAFKKNDHEETVRKYKFKSKYLLHMNFRSMLFFAVPVIQSALTIFVCLEFLLPFVFLFTVVCCCMLLICSLHEFTVCCFFFFDWWYKSFNSNLFYSMIIWWWFIWWFVAFDALFFHRPLAAPFINFVYSLYVALLFFRWFQFQLWISASFSSNANTFNCVVIWFFSNFNSNFG